MAPFVLRKRGAGGGTHKGTLFTNAAGKSDHCVIPEKAPNKARKGRRRGWREGGGSRGTAWSNTRARHRAGRPCHRDYMVCGKPHEETKD